MFEEADKKPSTLPDLTRRSVLGGMAGAGILAAQAKRVLAGGSTGGTAESSTPTSRRQSMTRWRPDPTFYPSPRSAMNAPAEKLAYVVRVNPTGDERPDAIVVVDVDPDLLQLTARRIGEVEMTNAGDELHHFGWNACSSMLCPNAAHPHVERRYLIVPALGSSRIYIIDTKPDPTQPAHRQDDRGRRSWPTRPAMPRATPSTAGRTASTSARSGAPDGDGPGGIFMLDHDTFDVLGRMGDRPWRPIPALRLLVASRLRHHGHQRVGHPQHGRDRRAARPAARRHSTVTTCTSGTCATDSHMQTLDLGKEHQIVLELRPAHDPTKAYGFVNVVISLKDLSSSIWMWHNGNERMRTLGRPRRSSRSRPSPPTRISLPPALQAVQAVPPLVTDIELSRGRSVPLRLLLGHR